MLNQTVATAALTDAVFSAPELSVLAACTAYRARLATTYDDRLRACRLRFLVFNVELNEGLQSAYSTGYDSDHFDDVCDHLLVEHIGTGDVVGTYRLQSGDTAARAFGYYSEQEFCFAPYQALRSEMIELGRACVHRDHRTADVLNLLWRGIMRYAVRQGARYLVGCCSINSQDSDEGWAVFAALAAYRAEPTLMTVPNEAFALPPATGLQPPAEPPRLLRGYLSVGARVCSSPAIDREFGTIDLLTMLDIQAMHPRVARRFL